MIADVCLILEGTYPYVSGGVSSWVHQLITQLPEFTFGILHIGPKQGYYKAGRLYELPNNVVSFAEMFLHDYAETRRSHARPPIDLIRGLLSTMRRGDFASASAILHASQHYGTPNDYIGGLLSSLAGWDVLVDAYRQEAHDESFLNFFWTWRYAYLPLFNLLSCRVPEARLYHTICTGYAGLLAATAKIRTDRPMVLTEHGIYLKERRIEINRATWIHDWESDELVAERQLPYFKQFWIQQFATMSRICYQNADEILTLHQGNAEEQMSEGGDPRRIRIVANGINLGKYEAAAQRLATRDALAPFTIGFIGRVTPIKDVKTFLNAMRLVADRVPDVRVRIMGGMEEDPSYAEECKQHALALHLEDIVKFEGRVDVIRELPTIDVVVLTSISESQPLAILEGGAVGLPFVATNVGSCAELAVGRTPADRQIGIGGLITPIASPGATARALLKLHTNPTLRKRMGHTMQERVRRFYNEDNMVEEYRELYGKYARAQDVAKELPEAVTTGSS